MSYMRSISSSKSLFFAILCLCASIDFAVDTVPQQVQDWQTAADALEKAGDFEGAHIEYEKIMKAYPDTSYGLDASSHNTGLYIKQKQLGSLTPAVEQICASYNDHPDIVHVVCGLAKECMYTQAGLEAIEICTKAKMQLASHPKVMLLNGSLGMIYASLGDVESAEQMKSSLLEQKDSDPSDFLRAIGDVGWGYYCAGELDRALQTYRQGLEKNSTHDGAVHLQYQIIKTQVTKEDFAAADTEMEVLLEKYSEYSQTPGLAFRVANEYYKKWNVEGAINVYEKLLSRFGDHELAPSIRGMEIKSYQTLAKGYRREKQTDRAIAAYETVLARFPESDQIPSIRDAIVETYADAGDLVKAQQALQADIEHCPHRRELLRMITRVAVDTARAGHGNAYEAMDTFHGVDPNAPNTETSLETAEKLVEAIFDQDPEGADQQLFGYTTRARIYVYQGRDAEVAATVEEALEQFKDNPDALSYHLFGVGEEYYLMAEQAARKQESKLASQYYQQAIDTWQNQLSKISECSNPHFRYYLGVSYQNIGQMDKAVEYYNEIVTKWPDYKKAWYSQFLIAKYYENQAAQNKASIEDVRAAYQTLLEKYPDCSAAKIATKKLNTL